MFASKAIAELVASIVAGLAATTLALTPPPPPQPIDVPAPLKARSATLEPSGVAWSAQLQRYLVVSDDTGPAESHHQPWLLAMSRAGAFDAEPLPIEGLRELNDAESICAGPDGTFFLATSHSPTKKGDLPPSRRMLLWLEPHGRALRVRGQLDLTTARGAHGEPLPELAGLHGRLDIEAIAYRDQALYVGLKSPLSERGTATILKLPALLTALRAGALPPNALVRAWELPLTATPSHVPEGIADLTFLPDGSLLLLANAPKGGPRDGGGALYRLPAERLRQADGAVVEPQLVRWFGGLKPEGVTLADDAKAVVLVFDDDLRPPLWLRLPLPLSLPTAPGTP